MVYKGMSDNEDVNAINKALDKELEGVDVEGIAEMKLRSLDRDYEKTIAANVKVSDEECEGDCEGEYGYEAFSGPGWQARFSDDSGEEEEEEEVQDEGKTSEIGTHIKDIVLTDEKIDKIKRIMGKIDIKPPFWARNLPDGLFAEQLKARILK